MEDTNILLSYHGNEKIKAKYLKRVKAHALADEIIKGKYWENGKGCAVGCTIHSANHAAYEKELGLPEWLARLEDVIFEGLQIGDAKSFPQKFLAAIPIGKDLTKVKWKFCAFVLKENIERVLALTFNEVLKKQVVNAIRQCLAVQEEAIKTGKFPESAAEVATRSARSAFARSAAEAAIWSAAESAAEAAAEAATRAATRAAAESAAEAAIWSAEAAIWSAEAAWSARAAVESARAAAYKRYADELLRLLKDA